MHLTFHELIQTLPYLYKSRNEVHSTIWRLEIYNLFYDVLGLKYTINQDGHNAT